jgi:hypothetical protein
MAVMRGISLAGLLLALALPAVPARAEPPRELAPSPAREEGMHVIPPGREAAARELLEPILVHTGGSLRWAGPTIEIDRIQWMLLRGEQVRARLLLIPRELAQPGDPTSHSFAIRVEWPPEVEPEPRERTLLEFAVEVVQAGDHGQFYRVRLDLFEPERPPAPPYQARVEADPSDVHRRWGLELGAVALLGLFALAVTLRPRASRP